MRIYEGSPRQGWEEVFRGIGAYVDRERIKELLLLELDAGFILQAMGMRLDTPGTQKTPARYLRALFDSTEGYEGDPKLVTAFPTECHGGADCQILSLIHI